MEAFMGMEKYKDKNMCMCIHSYRLYNRHGFHSGVNRWMEEDKEREQ